MALLTHTCQFSEQIKKCVKKNTSPEKNIIEKNIVSKVAYQCIEEIDTRNFFNLQKKIEMYFF